jgi:trehalose 6-phosphate phosphatase
MDGLKSFRPRPPAPHTGCALFLDVDGCLIEFAPTPELVIVPGELRRMLHLLSGSLDGAVALVSGRSVEALDALFWPLKLPAAGLHGNELRTRDGMLRKPVPCASMPRIVAEAVSLCMRYPGALAENKGSGIALHWRAAPEAETALRAFADEALARLPGYRLQPGHCVVELLQGDQDKGKAIAAFLEDPPFHGRRPVFAGDDLTDEPGFRAVNTHGGDSILIGTRDDSAARFSLPDPTSVRAWLATFTTEGPP